MKDKVVIITGGSSGIGLAMAHEFGRLKAKVVISARNAVRLAEAASELRWQKIEVLEIVADVSREEDCRAIIDKTVETFGRIDVLINNAGISMRSAFKDTDLKVIRSLMEINFWGTVYCTKFALPYLLETKGSVVGIISVAGYIGLPGRTGYSASKFAIRGFLDTLRCENEKTGLHVLLAAPGFTATNIRKVALLGDGSFQGKTPRNENKMMSAEKAARKITRAIIRRKKVLVLTFLEGKLAIFLNRFIPGTVSHLTYNHMAKEPESPLKN
ncbi:MAG: SDR family oxidoreductase [Lentimicrobium sp.]|nr:SDR family oxidoreductase [Lentimicrobium sp.]